MRQTETILLLNSATGLPQSATLVTGLSVTEMATVDSQWTPFLSQAVADAVARGVSRYDLPDHKHWEWERKARAMGTESLAFAIECDNETQSLMIVRVDRTSRLPQQSGKPLVYIDYLATAPWNLPELVPQSRYKKCGTQMVLSAIKYSVRLGFDGRVGLHSLKGAELFYQSQFGMRDLGRDPSYELLRYLELPGKTTGTI
ncbi:MAG: GNAT family N-acetyltransferase [Fibrella sp.]|nr:GNAT family N-acetyltransferase [Armatimonadota bacterium]